MAHRKRRDWAFQAIVLGVILVAAWWYFGAGTRAKLATASWDVPVSGRVTKVDHTAVGYRGWAQVWFEYTLDDGRRGVGVLTPRGHSTSSAEALSIAGGYRVGQAVRGWADPDDPTRAVIERGVPRGARRTMPVRGWSGLVLPVLGGALLAGGIAGKWREHARTRRERAVSQAVFDAAMAESRAPDASGGRARVRVRNEVASRRG